MSPCVLLHDDQLCHRHYSTILATHRFAQALSQLDQNSDFLVIDCDGLAAALRLLRACQDVLEDQRQIPHVADGLLLGILDGLISQHTFCFGCRVIAHG